jgi:lysophospholipase L1-like esterase
MSSTAANSGEAPSFGQAFAGKANSGLSANLLVLSDSTSDEIGEWSDLLIRAYAGRFPLSTVQETTWVDGGSTYPTVSTVQSGDGAHGTLTLYNCSVPSLGRPSYFLAPYFDAMVAAVQPDLVIVSLGHNEASAAALPFWRDDLLGLMETVTLYVPGCEVIALTQNPRTDGSAANQAQRRWVTANLAALRGWGLIDTYRLFLDGAGNTMTDLLKSDGIHPNAVGEQAMFNEVWRHLVYAPGPVGFVSRVQSSLAAPQSASVPLANADFSSFASPPTLTSWTATQSTLTKDATHYEGPNGYAVRQQSASAATSYIEQSITGDALKPYVGKVMTFAARIYVPSGQNSNVGRIHMRTTGGSNTISLNSTARTQGQGAFRWQLVSGRVDATAGTLVCRIYCENGASGTGDMTVDRVCLAVGVLPRDLR